MNKLNCPHCKRKWDGKECEICGFADDITDMNNTFPCPSCDEGKPYWSISCVKCWNKENMRLTTVQKP